MKFGASEAVKSAEVGMVGWALTFPARVPEIELDPEHFYDGRWGVIWRVIRWMSESREAIDERTVAARMERDGVAAPDGPGLLTQAMLQAALFPEQTAAIVRDGWLRRQVAYAASETLAALEGGMGGDELLSLALAKLAQIPVGQEGKARTISAMVADRFKQLVALAEAKAKGELAVTGVPTGIVDLDALLGGLQHGICTTVAARPGMGKSAFAMTVTAHAAAQGIGVHVFNMEDGESAYTDRALARESRVPAQNLRQCELNRGQLGQLMQAASHLREVKHWLVDDRGGISAEELVRSVRRALKENRTQVVVVDYVQLLRGPKGMDRTEVTNHAMEILGDAAKQDGLVYLVCAQLNRECEKRDNKRPLASDLKQSGAIEERSKAVICLYRPSVYREKDPETREPYPEDRIEILVRKNNNGQTGRVIATWDGPTTEIR